MVIWLWRVGILLFGTAISWACYRLYKQLEVQTTVLASLIHNFTQLVSNITALIEERKSQGGVVYGQRADTKHSDSGHQEGG